MALIDELFPADECTDEKLADAFMDGGSNFDTGEVQTSPFAQFGNVGYQKQMQEFLEKMRTGKARG